MRLAIVLTASWVIVGTVSLSAWQFNTDFEAAAKMRDSCVAINNHYPDQPKEDCWGEYQQLMKIDRSGVWTEAFWFTVGIAAVLWLLFAISYAAVKWILAGREQST